MEPTIEGIHYIRIRSFPEAGTKGVLAKSEPGAPPCWVGLKVCASFTFDWIGRIWDSWSGPRASPFHLAVTRQGRQARMPVLHQVAEL